MRSFGYGEDMMGMKCWMVESTSSTMQIVYLADCFDHSQSLITYDEARIPETA